MKPNPGLITNEKNLKTTLVGWKVQKETKTNKPFFRYQLQKMSSIFNHFFLEPFFLHVFFSRNQRRSNIHRDPQTKIRESSQAETGETEKAIRQFPWASIDSVSYDEAFNGPLTP